MGSPQGKRHARKLSPAVNAIEDSWYSSLAGCGPLMSRLLRAVIATGLIATGLIASLGCGLPDTPHAVGALADDSCLQCHQDGDYGATSIDHPNRRHCVSCHDVLDWRPVPHSLDMDDCVSCHERGEAGAPTTSHPNRPDCARCHASSM
jgi:hypothetical protein